MPETAPLDDKAREELLTKIAKGELTWASAIGITRTEAYGLAHAAHQLLQVGQVDRARKVLEGLVVLNPNDGYFHAFLGAICGQQGDEDAALASYTDALKKDPKNLAALVNRAELYLRRGQIEPALEDLARATKVDPTGKTPLGKRAVGLARGTAAALHAALDGGAPKAAAKAPEPPPKQGFFKGLFGKK